MSIINRNYGVMNIANYIVEYSFDYKKPITNLLLQKVVYYVYVDFLIERNTKLFQEPIEKWGYGPVAPDVYHNFKSNGISTIKTTAPIVIEDNSEEVGDINLFGMTIREFDITKFKKKFEENGDNLEQLNNCISKLLDDYSDNPFALVNKTYEEPMWSKHQSEIESGVQHLKYSDEEIMEYFNSNEK